MTFFPTCSSLQAPAQSSTDHFAWRDLTQGCPETALRCKEGHSLSGVYMFMGSGESSEESVIFTLHVHLGVRSDTVILLQTARFRAGLHPLQTGLSCVDRSSVENPTMKSAESSHLKATYRSGPSTPIYSSTKQPNERASFQARGPSNVFRELADSRLQSRVDPTEKRPLQRNKETGSRNSINVALTVQLTCIKDLESVKLMFCTVA